MTLYSLLNAMSRKKQMCASGGWNFKLLLVSDFKLCVNEIVSDADGFKVCI